MPPSRSGPQPPPKTVDLGVDPPDHALKVQAAGRRLGQHGSYLRRAAVRMRMLRSLRVRPPLR